MAAGLCFPDGSGSYQLIEIVVVLAMLKFEHNINPEISNLKTPFIMKSIISDFHLIPDGSKFERLLFSCLMNLSGKKLFELAPFKGLEKFTGISNLEIAYPIARCIAKVVDLKSIKKGHLCGVANAIGPDAWWNLQEKIDKQKENDNKQEKIPLIIWTIQTKQAMEAKEKKAESEWYRNGKRN